MNKTHLYPITQLPCVQRGPDQFENSEFNQTNGNIGQINDPNFAFTNYFQIMSPLKHSSWINSEEHQLSNTNDTHKH